MNHLSFCPHKQVFKNAFFHQWLFKLPSNTYLPPIESSCGWAPAVFLCERRSDPPGLLLGRLDIGTSLLKGHTLSRHYHSLKGKKMRKNISYMWYNTETKWRAPTMKGKFYVNYLYSLHWCYIVLFEIWLVYWNMSEIYQIQGIWSKIQHIKLTDFTWKTQEILKKTKHKQKFIFTSPFPVVCKKGHCTQHQNTLAQVLWQSRY